MPTVAEVVKAASDRLADITETPRLDSEILLAHALHISRAQLLAQLQDEFDCESFETLVKRRAKGEPIAYILGEWEFYSLSFLVEPPVLVPRPETEHLVEAVLEAVSDRPARVMEIGAGTGCVSVAIAVNAPGASLVTSDISTQYLDLARRNAVQHGVADRISFREGDLFAALQPDDPPFEVICSNPPYVAEGDWEALSPTIRQYEDAGCLLSGHEGLDTIERIIAEARNYLAPSGHLALEIGMGQYERVRELLEESGYTDIGYRRDLAGIERIAVARKPDA